MSSGHIGQKTKDNKFPLISIIIISLNRADTIEKAIISVLDSDYPNKEFIVIDGESSDVTPDLIKKYEGRIDKLIIEKDSGIYDAMNKAVTVATGDFLYFLGADDIILKGWNVLKEILIPGNTIYYGNAKFLLTDRIYDGKFSTIKLLFRNICQQAILYPASVFKKYRFSDRYPLLSDYHLNLILMADKEFRFQYIDKLLAVFSESGRSSREKDETFLSDRPEIIRNSYSFFHYLLFKVVSSLRRATGNSFR